MRVFSGKFSFLLTFFLFPAGICGAQSPVMLGDLNKTLAGGSSSNPAAYTYDPRALHLGNRFLVSGNQAFFQADDGVHGKELWVSDGTRGGTRLVLDIAPGNYGSSPWNFCAFRGKACFSAWTKAAGWEFWASDGTSAGTGMVADTFPGPEGGGFYSPVVMGKSLYFFARNSSSGPFALYRYDGGGKAPVLVKGGFALAWKEPVPAGKYIVFRGVTSAAGAEAWVTDGTSRGTVMIRDLPGVASGECSRPVAAGGKAWFCARGSKGWAIWETGGGKAVMIRLLPFPGRPWSYPVLLGSKVVFGSKAGNFGGDNPFVFDTKTKKVVLLKQVTRDNRMGFVRPVLWKGKVWFSGWDTSDPSHRSSLWYTDGTPAGTGKAVPEGVFPAFAWFDPAPASQYIFFQAPADSGNPNWLSLWRTDGTKAGTLCLDKALSRKSPIVPQYLTPLGGGILLAGSDPVSGTELWKSDGTAKGTGLLKEINPLNRTLGSSPFGFTGALGKAWFWAYTGSGPGGYQVWTTDGTPGGTKLFLPRLFGSPSPFFLGPFGVFFRGDSESLWKSDGTAKGTVRFFQGPMNWMLNIRPIASFGDKILLSCRTSKEGDEPWVTDGTASGTKLLADTVPGRTGGYFGEAVSLGRSAVFISRLGTSISRLWITDGTRAGTRILSSRLTYASGIVRLGGKVLFEGKAGGSLSGMEPWVTDGTPAGTKLLADIYPGTGDGRFLNPFRVGDRVFFLATDGSLPPGKYGLYSTDGTPAGTKRMGSFLFEGLLPIFRPWRGVVYGLPLGNGKVLFWPLQGGACLGPWITDGTARGTRLLKSVGGGGWPVYSTVGAWGAGCGKAVFCVPGTMGPKALPVFWRTDGTAAGTGPIASFSRMGWERLSSRAEFWGGSLFFSAELKSSGLEPWVLPLGVSAEKVGESCGPAELSSGLPRLGKPVSFRILGVARSGSIGIFLLGLPGGTPLALGGGQIFLLDPAAGILWAGASPAGAGSLTVPASPALQGARLLLQGAVFPVSSPPFGLDMTNAVLWTLGK